LSVFPIAEDKPLCTDFFLSHLKVNGEEASCNILLQSFSIPDRGKSFSLRQNMLTVSEICPNLLFNWYGNYLLGGTVVGRKVDHSPPFSPEVRNTWNYTSTPKCLHGVHMEKFTLFF